MSRLQTAAAQPLCGAALCVVVGMLMRFQFLSRSQVLAALFAQGDALHVVAGLHPAACCAVLSCAGDMFQAADNLHARMTHEVSRHADVLDLVEAAQAAGQLNFNMTAGSRIQLERLYKVTNALHLSLLQLDGQLALFNEHTKYT